MEKVIDVSDNQGIISWPKAKADGVVFAILRTVRGSGKADYQFANNVAGCRANGIGFDGYKYSYAKTEAASVKEAQQVVALLQQYGCGSEVTVWWDMEDKSLRSLGNNQLTKNIRAAKQVIRQAGYTFGIYCNQDWYDHVLDTSALADCIWWIAKYGRNDGTLNASPKGVDNLWGHQYTSRGRVDGINGHVDMNVLFDLSAPAESTEAHLPVLRKGSIGEAVKVLQSRLNAVGYACGSVDGIFGIRTQTAVIAFQAENGLIKDGIVGQKTWAELMK